MGRDGEEKIGNGIETVKNTGFSESYGDACLYGRDMCVWCWGGQDILYKYNRNQIMKSLNYHVKKFRLCSVRLCLVAKP